MNGSSSYSRLLPSESFLFASDRFDRDLVRDFLFVFSRAEYALKATGFVKVGPHDVPKIQWTDFARELGDRLFNCPDAAIENAQQYLVENPPKKQTYGTHGLVWKERRQRSDQSSAEFLIESATQVRHNLFHGGKDLMGRLAERDRELVQAAMLIIAFAISLHPQVEKVFQDDGPFEKNNSAVT